MHINFFSTIDKAFIVIIYSRIYQSYIIIIFCSYKVMRCQINI